MKKLILALAMTIASLGHCYDWGTEELADLGDRFVNRLDGLELLFHVIDPSLIPDAAPDAIALTFEAKVERQKRYYRFRQYNLGGLKNFDYVVQLRDGLIYGAFGGKIVDILENVAEGEPFFYFLESLDGEQCVFLRIVPYPRFVSSGNRRVTVSAMDYVPSAFVVETHDFPPGEEVHFTLQGDGEISDTSAIVDETGRAYVVVKTDRPPSEGGVLSVTVRQHERELEIAWPCGDWFFDPDSLRGKSLPA